MHGYDVFLDIAKIFAFATVVSVIFCRLNIPAVVAYILTGVLLGPSALALIKSPTTIDFLAELGVISLLFTLGLEFSLDKLQKLSKRIFFIGIFQLLFTIAVIFGLLTVLNFSPAQSFLLGGIVALSSTVIVMKMLGDGAQLDSIQGKIMLGVLIIQDLSLIPIMIILSNVNHLSSNIFVDMLISLAKAGFFIFTILFLSIRLSPKIMNFITGINREILLISSVAIASLTAILANQFGISLALGAFIAGLALSTTAHSKQVTVEIVPFRDTFAMIFFVSIGLLMDLDYFAHHWQLILGVLATVFLIKFLVIFSLTYLYKYPGQTAMWCALSLFQIGEFSFVLAKVGKDEGILNGDLFSLVIISALLTMLLTPFVIKLIPDIIHKLQRNKFWNKYFMGKVTIERKEGRLKDHIVICGFGPVGNSVAKILDLNQEKFMVIELNMNSVKKLKKNNVPTIYGDATHPAILKHANIDKAKVFVVTLPDIKSSELAIINARKLNSNLFIVARSRFQSNIEKLYQAGANVVIYEEYETSLSIMETVLSRLDYKCDDIETMSNIFRANKCQLLHESYTNREFVSSQVNILLNTEIEWFKIFEESELSGKTLQESNIRNRTGASIIAIIKQGRNIPNPSPDTILERGNIIVSMGSQKQLNSLRKLALA